MTLHYHVRALPRQHRFVVTLSFKAPAAGELTLRLPVWIPGSYLVREFARHVVSLVAWTQRRGRPQPLATIKCAKNAWSLFDVRAGQTVTCQYEVWAFERSVREAYLDEERALLNGTSLLLLPDGARDWRCVLELERPEGADDWCVATTLVPEAVDEAGFGRYRAADYDTLVDTPITMGRMRQLHFEAMGVAHTVAITGHGEGFDEERLRADLQRLCTTQIAFFGAAPFDRYCFHLHVSDDGYGGLEHSDSSVLLASHRDLPWPGQAENPNYRKLLGLFSHEYFHAWVVKRLRPRRWRTYDYFQENLTRLLWLFEGWTSYYDDLFLRRVELITPAQYLEALSQTLTAVKTQPGHECQPLDEASFDAWIKYYRPHAHSLSLFANYYAKGAVLAAALDWRLRAVGESLDAVLLALWRGFGATGLGIGAAEVFAAVEAIGGKALARWLQRQVTEALPEPLTTLAPTMGLRVIEEREALPAMGIRWNAGAKARGTLVVEQVLAGSAAEAAGIAPQDELLAVGPWRVRPDNWDEVLARLPVGQKVRVLTAREGVVQERSLSVLPPGLRAVKLVTASRISAAVRARREAWLGG